MTTRNTFGIAERRFDRPSERLTYEVQTEARFRAFVGDLPAVAPGVTVSVSLLKCAETCQRNWRLKYQRGPQVLLVTSGAC